MSSLIKFLGAHVSDLLATTPFVGWEVTRSVEDNPPEKDIWYEFEGHGVDVACDEAERISTIFLRSVDGEVLSGVAFSTSRQEVLRRFGTPSRSGPAVQIPGLGDKGAWDRFTLAGSSIHFQYRLDHDAIDMITLMRGGTEP